MPKLDILQQARIILTELDDKAINVNWNQERLYLEAIMNALKEIQKRNNE